MPDEFERELLSALNFTLKERRIVVVDPQAWTDEVRQRLQAFAPEGIRAEAAPAEFFTVRPHVAVRADGLDEVGVVHQSHPDDPFQLCVFEPSQAHASGWAEIFERSMPTLDELPKHVAAWRAFRAGGPPSSTLALAAHKKWLKSAADDLKRRLDSVRESGRLRLAGDLPVAWQAAGFDVRLARSPPAEAPPLAQERLQADFESIAPDLLAWRLPRDDKGKPLLGRRTPLFRYDEDRRRGMTYCLLVAMPEKRSGVPEIRAEWLQADLQTARLDALPEAFDLRAADRFAPELLGVEPKKAAAFWSPRKPAADGPVQAMRLQYEGEFVEAAAVAGVELDERVLGCLQCRRVAHMCTCCAPLDRQLREWSAFLMQALTAMNLPRIGALASRDQTRRPASRKEPIPILPFPLQRHIRKAHLGLELRRDACPRLTIHVTGSGARLPLPLWKRPLEVDLLHAGLLAPADLPPSVATQLGIGG